MEQGRRIRRGDNEDILELARAYPQTFIPFAGLNPYDADLPDRVDALARQGFRGVCLDGGWRRSLYYDDPLLEPIWDARGTDSSFRSRRVFLWART